MSVSRFDIDGAGACLKRYSDPTYFKRSLTNSDMKKERNIQNEKKAHRRKVSLHTILGITFVLIIWIIWKKDQWEVDNLTLYTHDQYIHARLTNIGGLKFHFTTIY